MTRRVALAAVSGMWFGIAACKGHAQQSEKNGAGAVEFLVGDLMADEGGEWEPESGPLRSPFGVDFDGDGNLYVVELGGGRVHRLDPAGQLRPVAGDGSVAGTGVRGWKDGPALQAQLGSPKHLCTDEAGNVYIADDQNGAIRRYDPHGGTVTTLLGRGMGDSRIRLKNPHGVRVQGEWLYVVDTGNHRLMRLPLAEEK